MESRFARLVHTTYRINQRAFKMWQVEGPRKEREEWEALGIIESQAAVLEWSVVTLDSQLDKDIEERPGDSRAAVKELTKILKIMGETHARMAVARRRKKRIMKRLALDHIMDLIDDKWEEAKEYRQN